jgi:hypothetical protein
MLREWNAGRPVFAATYASRDEDDQALMRYPGTGGLYDGHPCTCTAACPAACDGDRCGCQVCERAWIDGGLDEMIGTTWRAWQREE